MKEGVRNRHTDREINRLTERKEEERKRVRQRKKKHNRITFHLDRTAL